MSVSKKKKFLEKKRKIDKLIGVKLPEPKGLTAEEKAISDLICEARVSSALSKHRFSYSSLSEGNREKVLNDQYDLPNQKFDGEVLKELLIRTIKLVGTKNCFIAKGCYKDEDFSLKWELLFWQTPLQLQLIKRDAVTDYPSFSIYYKYAGKEDVRDGWQREIWGNKVHLTLGDVLSLLTNSKEFEWL